jgi:uncharacterized protein (DUF1499 family)
MGILAGQRPQSLGKISSSGSNPTLQAVKTHLTNAVSSFATTKYHAIAPLPGGVKMWAKLDKVVREMPGAKVIATEPDYLYAEFTTHLLGFVDDVEFLHDGAQQKIHVRSASRLGRKDFDVNRNRIELIRRRLAA